MDLGSQAELVGHVVLALLLGGVVGLEREMAAKSAGLRTNMLIAGASAMLVGLALPVIRLLERTGHTVEADPVRVIQAIVIGISFIVAGTIIRREDSAEIEGLTTAAALLMSAGLGILIAVGYYAAALAIALIVVTVLRLVQHLENWASRKNRLRKRPGAG